MRKSNRYDPPAIAVVGISAIFPDAVNARCFWNNILTGKDSITDVPPNYWLVEDYYDPDPKKKGKTYARRGAFLPRLKFDPTEFGLPPKTLASIDSVQLLSLVAARDLLNDCRSVQSEKVDRKRISVILGSGAATDMMSQLVGQIQTPNWVKAMRDSGLPETVIEEITQRAVQTYTAWTENSFPGSIGNVTAGRIANRLNLGGTNCVVDAACASSLGAVDMAIQELQLGHSDLAITGGADASNDIFTFMCFSKTPALSPTGDCRPFSDRADGTLLGEGIGMVALRRLEDAQRDGDTIYGLIRGIGSSSDGMAKSIYAPLAEGQALAIQRAFEQAGLSPQTVELVEAHGTATKANDVTEFNGLCHVFDTGPNNHRRWCALGSIKSQIGHTKTAAGAASLIKTVLALHHKVLPPTIKIDKPNPDLDFDHSPFYLNTAARPWVHETETSRKASVSAFGFGGSNFHLVLEEYRGPGNKAKRFRSSPVELLLLSAGGYDAMDRRIEALAEKLKTAPLAELARTGQAAFRPDSKLRLALLVKNSEEAAFLLKKARQRVKAEPERHFFISNKIHYGVGTSRPKIAFLFPGQGSQYLNMGADLAMEFKAAQQFWDRAARQCRNDTEKLHPVIFPIPAFSDDDRQKQADLLNHTQWAQPAVCAASLSQLHLLRAIGIAADCTAGHGCGEIAALLAAGALTADKDVISISRRRGNLMAWAAANPAAGAMTAVTTSLSELQKQLEDTKLPLTIANINSPRQFVLSGALNDIEKLERKLAQVSIPFQRLPASGAFHSNQMNPSVETFHRFLATFQFGTPDIPVYANCTGKQYPEASVDICKTLAGQIARPVLFKDLIEAMYADGVRVFVEVGPGQDLTRFVKDCLGTGDYLAVAIDQKDQNGVTSLWNALGMLAAAGVDIRFDSLWKGFAAADSSGDRKARSSAAIEIDGSNYGKPYPPKEGAAALPKPIPDSPAASKNSTGTGSNIRAFSDAIHANDKNDNRQAGIANEQPQTDTGVRPGMHADAIKRVLLEIVSEQTGYPIEVLDFKTDLESGFGIDSIKKMEILSGFQDRFSDIELQDTEALSGLGTLEEILEYVKATLGPPGVAKTDQRAAPDPGQTGTKIHRYTAACIPAPPNGQALAGLESADTLYIIEDNRGVSPALSDKLNAKGIDSKVVQKLPEDAGAVLFLKGINALSPGATVDEAIELNRSVFEIARKCGPRLHRQGGVFITVQDTHADFGLSGGSGERAWSAGIGALAKTAAKEWPEAFIKAIDIQSSHRSAEDMAESILSELTAGGPEPEVGLNADGKRVRVDITDCKPTGQHRPLPGGTVVMVSGGGRGITAACLLALADRSQLKMVVLGRSAIAEEPEFVAGCETDAQIKQAIATEYKRQDRKITPAEMASEARNILACRKLRSTLHGLEARGSQVKYFAVDIRNADALNRIVKKIHNEWGDIQMLIHAAGVISDKTIHEKTIAQFDEVFTTKVSGFRNLLSATRNDPLTRIVCFSSVVARKGNAGQADYAMANETLNKVCQFEHKRRNGQCIVKALNWGPWDAGMVTPQHRSLFQAAGYALIPVDEGARLFVGEMEDDQNDGPVEIILTGDPGNRRNAGLAAVTTENEWFHPWIMKLESHKWVTDHRPTFTVPVLPLMFEVDMMCRAAASLFPEYMPIQVTSAESRRWAAFDGGVLRGQTLVSKIGRNQASVELQLQKGTGDTHRFETAAVCRIVTREYPTNPDPERIPDLKGAADGGDPYKAGTLFHGPAFQLMTGWVLGQNGANCRVMAESRGVPYGLLHPGLLDGALHCLPLYRIETWYPDIGKGKIAFPLRMESFFIYDRFPESGLVDVAARMERIDKRYFPVIKFWLKQEGRLLAVFNLVLTLLPEGPLKHSPPLLRKAFFKKERYVEEIALTRLGSRKSILSIQDANAFDWLPGTLSSVYGLGSDSETNFEQIAMADHCAGHLKLHPSRIIIDKATGRCANLPLNAFQINSSREKDRVIVQSPKPADLDIVAVRQYWSESIGFKKNIIFDLLSALIQKFVRRVIVEDPVQLKKLRETPVLYLANHQTGIESLLFACLMGSLAKTAFCGIANQEQQYGMFSVLIDLSRQFVNVLIPLRMLVFNQHDRESLPSLLNGFAAGMRRAKESLYVAVEGRRAVSAGHQVTRMSSIFIDLAIKEDLPIIPVRFAGGLPQEGNAELLDFPYDCGQQDYYFGRAIYPSQLHSLSYAARPRYILNNINLLGPDLSRAEPLDSDRSFNERVANRSTDSGISEFGAVLIEALNLLENPCDETRALLEGMKSKPDFKNMDKDSLLYAVMRLLTLA